MTVFDKLRRALLTLLGGAALCTFGAAQAQNNATQLAGVVTGSDKAPLAKVSVVVEGAGRRATTDSQGRFVIDVRSNDLLSFSHNGYEAQTIRYVGQSDLTVRLTPESKDIEEIVVVGYGVQRKRDVTGSITSVKSEDLATTVAAANPMQALQGKVAGLEIIQNSAPGGAPTVRVRGVSSFRNSNPVYVVDGLIMDDIAFINANEIQSIEVLKDASSTAIYGSRGANGVLIITTKMGIRNQPLSLTISSNISVSQMERYLPYATASEFLTLKNRHALAMNVINDRNDPMPYTEEEILAAGKGTDWQKEITRVAITQNHNLNLVGGTEKSTYGLSAGFFDQQGVMKKSDYQRASFKLSNTYDLTPWATLGSNISFVYEHRNSQGSSLSSALRALPTAPVRDPDDPSKFFGPVDEIGKSGNPAAALYYSSDNYSRFYKTIANIFADVKIIEGLRFRSAFTLNNANSEGKAYYPKYKVNDDQERKNNQLNINQSRAFTWLNENTLTYSFSQGKHNFSVLGGMTLQQNKSQNENLSVLDLPNSAWKNRNLWYTGLGNASTLSGGSGGLDFTYVSYLGRANYSFDNKYLLTATVRVDASSRFPVNGRYGTFPAFGAGWVMKEEGFLKDVNWLSQLKLRTSYGIVGSDAGIPNNIQTVYVNRVTGVFGENPASATVSEVIDMVIDAGLSWEEAKQFNIGVDFGALRNRLTLEMDYYVKTTANILTSVTQPGLSGTNYAPIFNIATARNQGLEFNIGWRDTKGDMSYHANLIGTTLKNKVTSVNRDLPPLEGGVNRTLVGYPIGGFWGYEVLGIYQDQKTIDQTANISGAIPGDLWYKDQNGDGTIDNKDRIYMGSYLPKATLGFNFGGEWKGISLSVDLYASLGNKIYSLRRQELGVPNYNVSNDQFKNSWIGPGSTNKYTRVLLDGPGTSNNQFSEYFIEDGSYFRIRNVVLGYSFPKEMIKKAHFKSLMVYVAGNNLLTATKVTGYSPECGGGPNGGGHDNFGNYPASRTISFGVNIGF